MPIEITRPATVSGQRLFYRPHFKIENGCIADFYRGPGVYTTSPAVEGRGRFVVASPENVLIQLRLRKWFRGEAERVKAGRQEAANMIQKDQLMKICFADHPSISKHYVGRLMRACVQYEVNFQKQRVKGSERHSDMRWRWLHPLEFVYAIDHLMIYWLPRLINKDGGQCHTVEDYEEELEILNDQSDQEDLDLVQLIIKHQIR